VQDALPAAKVGDVRRLRADVASTSHLARQMVLDEFAHFGAKRGIAGTGLEMHARILMSGIGRGIV
jgi:hypothetical protein